MNKNIFSFIISVPVTRYWTKYFSCRFFNRLQFQLLGSGIFCDNIPGLSSAQKKLCRNSPDVMRDVGAGIQLAEEECQHQFRHRRWNCSIFSYQSRDRGESEMAFVAI